VLAVSPDSVHVTVLPVPEEAEATVHMVAPPVVWTINPSSFEALSVKLHVIEVVLAALPDKLDGAVGTARVVKLCGV